MPKVIAFVVELVNAKGGARVAALSLQAGGKMHGPFDIPTAADVRELGAALIKAADDLALYESSRGK